MLQMPVYQPFVGTSHLSQCCPNVSHYCPKS
nr:MAG TPA: hypothetical protein [Caudoviricetes sp.]